MNAVRGTIHSVAFGKFPGNCSRLSATTLTLSAASSDHVSSSRTRATELGETRRIGPRIGEAESVSFRVES